jgi:hypothetical protein
MMGGGGATPNEIMMKMFCVQKITPLSSYHVGSVWRSVNSSVTVRDKAIDHFKIIGLLRQEYIIAFREE